MIKTTLMGMENYSYDRATKTLYRGHRVVKPCEGVYTMKYRKIKVTKTAEEIHGMTDPDHRPLNKLKAMIRSGDEEDIAEDRLNGMSYLDLCEKYHCSASTIARAVRITSC